ncbi:hypothetical protein GCM10009001_18960 [Virgibacillus siamensis]|uniref:Uncharacterized protein n=1 Tax=Virgibacillus siamensis TaxID=480071 RepID=A0ABN1G1J5_9BACI
MLYSWVYDGNYGGTIIKVNISGIESIILLSTNIIEGNFFRLPKKYCRNMKDILHEYRIIIKHGG